MVNVREFSNNLHILWRMIDLDRGVLYSCCVRQIDRKQSLWKGDVPTASGTFAFDEGSKQSKSALPSEL